MKKRAGFTLIELLIVLSIVGVLVSLVGPLTIDAMEKAEARTEKLKLRNWLRYVSHQSYLKDQNASVRLNGKMLTLEPDYGRKIEMQFEHLFFTPQALVFNQNGFVSPDVVTLTTQGKTQSLSLTALINADED